MSVFSMFHKKYIDYCEVSCYNVYIIYTKEDIHMATSTIESLGMTIGKGTCSVMNSFRTASDNYKDYYANKEHKGIFDYVANAANTLGRAGVSVVKGVAGVAKDVWNSDEIKAARSGIAETYTKMREKYGSYLTKTAEQLRADAENPEKAGFKTNFKMFLNNTLKVVDNVYKTGESAVKSVVKGISSFDKGFGEGTAAKKSEYEKFKKAKEDIKDAEDDGLDKDAESNVEFE